MNKIFKASKVILDNETGILCRLDFRNTLLMEPSTCICYCNTDTIYGHFIDIWVPDIVNANLDKPTKNIYYGYKRSKDGKLTGFVVLDTSLNVLDIIKGLKNGTLLIKECSVDFG